MISHRVDLEGATTPSDNSSLVAQTSSRADRLATAAAQSDTRARKPAVFLHIHKNAGSWMCDIAKSNNETTPNNAVCVIVQHDSWAHRCNLPVHFSCPDRSSYVNRSNLSFHAIEREFRETDYCPDTFLYATFVRDPIARMESFYWYDDGYKAVETFNTYNRSKDRGLSCIVNGTECPGADSPYPDTPFVHFDNYMIRILGGPEVMRLPPRAIT